MRDAAIERLSKIISDSPSDSDGNNRLRSRRLIEVHIGLAEGWFSLFLLAAVVYSTIWSVQAVQWVDHLNILSFTTAVGLLIGVVSSKQQRFPRLLVHVAVICFGLLLAFWQTAGAFYGGNVGQLVQAVKHWLSIVSVGGTGDEDAIFLFFIVALGFILAYTSAWLVYRTRSPWLMIVANAVVLLINLSNVDAGYVIFLVLFLVASLLLLLRFNLYESVCRWQRQGLRYADDIGWDIMQAGALVSIGILIFSWILPANYQNPLVSQVWNASSNPWVHVQDTWNRLVSVSGGAAQANHGNFRDTLVLSGNPNLNHDLVATVQTSDNSAQYLTFVDYGAYNNRLWAVEPAASFSIKANEKLQFGGAMTRAVKQTITIVSPPGEEHPYLLGASQITSISLPSKLLLGSESDTVVAWMGLGGNLATGSQYTVTSAVSSADINTLSSVPMPKDSPSLPIGVDEPTPTTYFDPAVVRTYTQLPSNLDPRIRQKAAQIVSESHAGTMYQMTVALENYLRSHYKYQTDIHPPSSEDPVSWFLFDSNNQGFCNYFASAMVLMARSLGIPARMVAGYTAGQYDTLHHTYKIYGTDAHSWAQVYFAGYGWINFEPSASFAPFTRPLPSTTPDGAGNAIAGVTGAIPPLKGKIGVEDPNNLDSSSSASALGQARLDQDLGVALGGLILLGLFGCIAFGLWWRRLYRRFDLATQLYGRICLLAGWAGIKFVTSQTPYEYLQSIEVVAPQEAAVLERLGDIYVRGRWADPESKDHPGRSGEIDELPGMWKRLQPHLFLYVLRHPHFLRWLPARIGATSSRILGKWKSKKFPNEEI